MVCLMKLMLVKQEKHLGQGTRTNIYAGKLKLRNEDDEGFLGHEVVDVVLKVLGAGHNYISVSDNPSFDDSQVNKGQLLSQILYFS